MRWKKPNNSKYIFENIIVVIPSIYKYSIYFLLQTLISAMIQLDTTEREQS